MTANTGENIFRSIYNDIKNNGDVANPRGLKIIELQNYSYELPPYARFCNFEARKLNINYIKDEFLWYLKGDAYDTSITEHATMWKSLIQDDGTINSNYGQYIFGKQNQFDVVKQQIENDIDTRRASIIILNKDHVQIDTVDEPCTYAINFRVRNNKLNMTVHMRSQDAIYGMGNDAPCFSFVHEMMYNSLLEKYPTLEHGNYFHFTDSFHVYERHFDMLDSIVGNSLYETVECPKINGYEEVNFLRKLDFSNVPEQYQFTKWLIER